MNFHTLCFMILSMCSAVKYFWYLHHQSIAVSSKDQHKSLVRSSLLKTSMTNYCENKHTQLQQMRRTNQERPPKRICAKYVGVWQSVTWSSFEGCFLNCLVLFHIRASSSLISEKQACEGLSTSPGTWCCSKNADSQQRGELIGLSDRNTFPLLCSLLWLHLSRYTEQFWGTDLAISLQSLTFLYF